MSFPESTTPVPTLVNVPFQHALASQSRSKKLVLFSIFCIAQFLDVFSNSALLSGIPAIKVELGMDQTEASWILNAYSLTFSALLLVSGRMSDVWSPKPVFTAGITGLGVMCLILGFLRNKVVLLAIRALAGMAAALTIPPALNMIVQMFPNPKSQARAISIFGGVGALANMLGFIIGALLIQYTSWPWIFWFATILAIPCAVLALVLIPTEIPDPNKKETGIDIVGVSTLACALLLFIFSVTSGSAAGWASARVLAPLFISLVLAGAFLFWESRMPEHKAALPPKMWFYPNFGVLIGVALLPYFWYTTIFVYFTSMWQEVWHWSSLECAIRLLPSGIVAAILSLFVDSLPKYFNMKYILLISMCITMGSTALFSFGATAADYWRFILPAFILSGGQQVVFSTTNIALFKSTPSNVAGTVGAVFNSALQLGCAVGVAAATSIQTSIDAKTDPHREGYTGYEGRSAGFWFVVAFVGLQTIAIAVFYRPERSVRDDEESPAARSEDEKPKNESGEGEVKEETDNASIVKTRSQHGSTE